MKPIYFRDMKVIGVVIGVVRNPAKSAIRPR